MTQSDLLPLVYPPGEFHPEHRAMMSQWERGIREPSRDTLIRYAEFAAVTLDMLLRDDCELPSCIARAAEQKAATTAARRGNQGQVVAGVNDNLPATEESAAAGGKSPVAVIAADGNNHALENLSDENLIIAPPIDRIKVNLYLETQIKRRIEQAQIDLRRLAPSARAGAINYSLIVAAALEIMLDEMDGAGAQSRLAQAVSRRLPRK